MWDLRSPTRDRPCTPCPGRQSFNHWMTRQVPELCILNERMVWYMSCISTRLLSKHSWQWGESRKKKKSTQKEMNCEAGKNQRGIKRVPRRKEKVCCYKKSQKGFHLIPEKTALSKVVFWKLQEGKNREREREARIHVANVGNRQRARLTADYMHQSGESGHQRAEWKIQPRTERQEKNFEIKIKLKETGERLSPGLCNTDPSPSAFSAPAPCLPGGFPRISYPSSAHNRLKWDPALPIRQRGPSWGALCLALMTSPGKQEPREHTQGLSRVMGLACAPSSIQLPGKPCPWPSPGGWIQPSRNYLYWVTRKVPWCQANWQLVRADSSGVGQLYFLSHQTSGLGTRPWGRKSWALVFSCDMWSGGKSFQHRARFLCYIHAAFYSE